MKCHLLHRGAERRRRVREGCCSFSSHSHMHTHTHNQYLSTASLPFSYSCSQTHTDHSLKHSHYYLFPCNKITCLLFVVCIGFWFVGYQPIIKAYFLLFNLPASASASGLFYDQLWHDVLFLKKGMSVTIKMLSAILIYEEGWFTFIFRAHHGTLSFLWRALWNLFVFNMLRCVCVCVCVSLSRPLRSCCTWLCGTVAGRIELHHRVFQASLKVRVKGDGSRWRKTAGISQLAAAAAL